MHQTEEVKAPSETQINGMKDQAEKARLAK